MAAEEKDPSKSLTQVTKTSLEEDAKKDEFGRDLYNSSLQGRLVSSGAAAAVSSGAAAAVQSDPGLQGPLSLPDQREEDAADDAAVARSSGDGESGLQGPLPSSKVIIQDEVNVAKDIVALVKGLNEILTSTLNQEQEILVAMKSIRDDTNKKLEPIVEKLTAIINNLNQMNTTVDEGVEGQQQQQSGGGGDGRGRMSSKKDPFELRDELRAAAKRYGAYPPGWW